MIKLYTNVVQDRVQREGEGVIVVLVLQEVGWGTGVIVPVWTDVFYIHKCPI